MISMIACRDMNGGIGYNNELLFNLKKDMEFFKTATLYKTVVMGRLTYLSIGKPLKDRKNIILTSRSWDIDDVYITEYADEIIDRYKDSEDELVVIGGENVYRVFSESAKRLYITDVDHMAKNADTFFPRINGEWECIYSHPVHDEDYKYTLKILEKVE